MRKFVALLLLISLAVNSVVGAVGTLVVCSHNDHIHLELEVRHNCEHDFSDIGNDSFGGEKFKACTDFIIQDTKTPAYLSGKLKIALPTFTAVYVFCEITPLCTDVPQLGRVEKLSCKCVRRCERSLPLII